MDDTEQTCIAPGRLRRNAPRFLAGGLLAAVVLSGALLALYGDFVAAFDRPAAEAPPRVDLIVVLSGGAGRLDEGLRLLEAGRAPLLFLVGFQSRAVASRLAADPVASSLARAGRILVEPRSGSTLEDAERTRVAVARHQARAILLITSVYHMQRAEMTFRKILPPSVSVYGRPVRSAAFLGDGWREDEPSRRLVVGEFLKYLFYRVRLSLYEPAES
ncbi:MAG TPA: YdcF family protein [Thermodesulfobacteriota bacterium]